MVLKASLSYFKMDSSTSKENVYQLLSALRLQNPTQYYTLVKMHLSFATDHATDQCDGSFDNSGMITTHRWNLSPIVRFIRGTNSSLHEADKFLLTVDVVHQFFELIRFLNKDENIMQEGLFRKTGSVMRQAELKAALQAGKNLNLDSEVYSAHDCASVLKSFLADLPEPLLQEEQYHVHCRIAELCGQNDPFTRDSVMYTRQVRALQLVFLLLPSLNYEILKELLFFLKRVASFQDVNKMSAVNLGTMFAPHILCPRKIAPNDLQHLSGSLSYAIAFLIENATDLFKIPTELGIDVMEYFRTSEIETTHSSTNPQEVAATKTSLSFVDRKLTAEATDQDMTEVALAELYAYVQSLPDSAKKRKLITQFNDVNGHGTPKYDLQNTQIHTQKKAEFKMKSFGDSIKKHLFSRSVKKTKPPRQLKKILNIKRSNSHEIYSTSSYASPELKRKPQSPKTKAKSFDNLLSSKPALSSHSDGQTLLSFSSESDKTISFRSLSVESDVSSQVSSIITSPLTLKNDTGKSNINEVDGRSWLSTFRGENQSMPKVKRPFIPNRISTPLESGDRSSDKSNRYSEKACRDNAEELTQESSPITRAIRNLESQQGLMMTPRSRCPIIIGSSSSLSSIATQSEHLNITKTTVGSSSPVCNDTDTTLQLHHCNNTARAYESSDEIDYYSCRTSLGSLEGAIGSSPEKKAVTGAEARVLEHNSPVSILRSDSNSFFEGFFKHLSTSSLIKLVSKLSSNASPLHNEARSSPPESSHSSPKDETYHDESLSSVFKDYLLTRSILTDNPVDLSSDNLAPNEDPVCEGNNYSEVLSSNSNSLPYNPSKELEKAIPKLSCSLLFCLDGNNPHDYELNPAVKRHSYPLDDCPKSQSPLKKTKLSDSELITRGRTLPAERIRPNVALCQENCSQSAIFEGANNHELHSCSPDGRRASILKNRNGTPMPRKERTLETLQKSEKSTQRFETDL